MEEGAEVGDGRAEGSSATGDGGPAASDNAQQTHEPTYMIGPADIFESSQPGGSYVWDLLYYVCHN